MFGLSVKNFGHDAIYHHSLSFASQQKVILISRGSFSPFLGSRVCRFVSQIMLTSHQNVLQRSFVVRQTVFHCLFAWQNRKLMLTFLCSKNSFHFAFPQFLYSWHFIHAHLWYAIMSTTPHFLVLGNLTNDLFTQMADSLDSIKTISFLEKRL